MLKSGDLALGVYVGRSWPHLCFVYVPVSQITHTLSLWARLVYLQRNSPGGFLVDQRQEGFSSSLCCPGPTPIMASFLLKKINGIHILEQF